MRKVLEGIRVIEFTNFQAGPVCSMILADLGAEVIKVEPLEGESGRRSGTRVQHGESLAFHARNRNKLSFTLDVKSDNGKRVLRDLVAISDVFVQNFRVGVVERLGFGFPALRQIQPQIIMTSISGYGRSGPYAHLPAHDMLIQALSGIMSLNGGASDPPTRVGVPIADRMGGIVGALGTLAALLRRTATGEGEHVDVAMLDALLFQLDDYPLMYQYQGKLFPRMGNHYYTGPNGYYECKDGAIYITASGDARWKQLCDMIGRPDIVATPQFATNISRGENQDAIDQIVQSWTRQRTVDEVLHLAEEFDVPTSAVLDIPRVLADRQVQARRGFVELEHALLGKVLYHGPLLKMDPWEPQDSLPAPLVGEHNGYVLRDLLGHSEKEIQSLEREGVVCPKD